MATVRNFKTVSEKILRIPTYGYY